MASARVLLPPLVLFLLAAQLGSLLSNLTQSHFPACASLPPLSNKPSGGDPPFDGNSLPALLTRAASRTAALYPTFPNLVLIAEANYGFRDLVTNFIHHARLTKPPLLPLIVFFALDPHIHAHILSLKASSYLDPAINFSSDAQSFRSKDYNKIVGHKFHLVLDTLTRGHDVFLIDVDVVPLRNPLNYLQDLAVCDMTVTLEDFNPDRLMTLSPTRFGGWPDFKIFINTGVLLWRSTAASIELIREFLKPKWRRPNSGDDQNEFNKFMLAFFDDSTVSERQLQLRTFTSFEPPFECFRYGPVTMQVLSASLFPGAYHMEFRMPQRAMVEPYLAHFNTLNGFVAKRNYMLGEKHNSECWYKWGCEDFYNLTV